MEEQHQVVLGKLISNQTKSRIAMEKNHSKILKKMAKEGKDTEEKQNQLKGELQELLNIQDVKVDHFFLLILVYCSHFWVSGLYCLL